MEKLLSYLTVFLTAMFRFLFAPIIGAMQGLSIIETWLCTALGMTTGVVIFIHFGHRIRNWYFRNFVKKRRVFSKRSRQIVRLWRKYGIIGVAFLTPVFFSPVVGTLIAASFGEKKRTVILYMGLAAAFWGLILSIITINFGTTSFEELRHLFVNEMDF